MTRQPEAPTVRLALQTGVILGVGLMGAADEILFHQILQWHNFYVHGTDYWRIASDGLFHAFTAVLLFLAAFLLWRRRRQFSALVSGYPFWSGVFWGAGGFQLFDGVVNHKLLRLHPVREGVQNVVPYDVGWIISAVLFLYCGWMLWRGGRPRRANS